MHIEIEDSVVIQKTKELCQTILEQPDMISIRSRIDAFMGDEQSRAQYDDLLSKGEALQRKQESAMPLSAEEISGFESQREKLLGNPVARGFLDAQEQLHTMQHSINKLISKSFELGRVPTDEDMECCGGGGGHSCGCSH
jgi:cell fate (sporulation/competence/biofilm development) regulator YlbF (YheA/YmcA/DUF963 family)